MIRLHGADGDWWREEYTRKAQRDSEVTGQPGARRLPKNTRRRSWSKRDKGHTAPGTAVKVRERTSETA